VRTSISDGAGTGRGCGGIWSSPVFDASALDGDGLVIFGTSNCGNADPTHTEAESEGVYAIRATTGALVWEFHPRGYNDDDDDFGASPNLLPGGLVGNGGKDGRYYAFDRATGARPWTSHPAQSGHLNPQFAFGGIIGTPAVGAVDGEPAIFLASALSTPIGDPNTGLPDATLAEDPQRMLSLHAISAVDGRVLWRSALARPSFGAPTYANGVVFVPGTVSFALQAYDADTGLLLLERPILGAPSSSPTIVGDTVLIGTGTSIDPLPSEAQQNGLRAFALPADPVAPGAGLLLSPQANNLEAYDLSAALPGTTRTTPIHAHSTSEFGSAPGGTGNDANGQNCAITQADGSVRYVMGEDSNQGNDVPDPATDNPDRDGDGVPGPSGQYQGWGLFVPTSGATGPWTLADKLVPAYNFSDPPNDHLPDNTGCALRQGNPTDPADDVLFLVDIGVGAFDTPGVGSLFAYYRDARGNFSHDSKFCVLDNHLTTAGYIAVDPDDGSVLVPESGRSTGGVISRFSGPFPPATGPDCAYDVGARKSNFLAQSPDLTAFTPISIARRKQTWVIGNVVPPSVLEYNLDGTLSRPLVLAQPTPGVAGVAVDANDNVYFANLGLAPCDTVLCPVDGLGTLWKLAFDPVTDAPLPPLLLQANLTYPEGMGIADPLPEPPFAASLVVAGAALAGLRRTRARRRRAR
jgi:outer membrane protein assembly factor BamB